LILTSRTLAKKVAEFALSKKASDVLLMDLRKLTAPADFFVVCSADSDTHARAIADAVRNGTDEIGVSLWHSEGFRALSWVLLDYVDVVVHVFKKDVRPFYNLERLWGDAKLTSIEDTPPSQRPSGGTSAKRPLKKTPRRTKKAKS
jgi:ribosome-associated protein